MTDTFGALPVPVPLRPLGDPVGDPLLAVLLSFFKATLNADGRSAWNQVAPGEPLVRTTFAHDPADAAFNDRDSPALYLWREQVGKVIWHAQDYYLRPTTLRLLWVFAASAQEVTRIRSPILNALQAVHMRAIEGPGRHPAWVVQGDTDPLAPVYGSLLWRFAKVFRLELTGAKPARLTIEMQEGEPVRRYYAVDSTIDVLEQMTFDPTVAGVEFLELTGSLSTPSDTNPTPLDVQDFVFTLP